MGSLIAAIRPLADILRFGVAHKPRGGVQTSNSTLSFDKRLRHTSWLIAVHCGQMDRHQGDSLYKKGWDLKIKKPCGGVAASGFFCWVE